MMRVLDLFSGIGGFSLGLERTGGFKTIAFCEIEPFCRRVLAKHWPEVPCYEDVRQLTAERLAADGLVPVDVICGGFPCQDISVAGKGVGIDGERSGIWSEYARLIGELRPQFVIVENVAALLNRGLDRVLGDLAALGFDAEWHCIPASAVGAPHRRDRVWIVAHPSGDFVREQSGRRNGACGTGSVLAGDDGPALSMAYPADDRVGWRQQQPESGEGARNVDDAGEPRLPAPERETILSPRRWHEGRAASERGWWRAEPDVGRVANGIPGRVDRLRALGNAVVPQIPEMIGRAILASETRAS